MSRISTLRVVPIVLVLIFLAIQLFFISTPHLTPDEALYAWKTDRLKENPLGFFEPDAWESHPPILPLIAAFLPLPALLAMRFLSIIAGIIVILLSYRITRRIMDETHANETAIILTFSPLILYYSHFGILDMALAASILLILDCMISSSQHGTIRTTIIPLIISSLIKTKAIMIGLPIIIMGFFAQWWKHQSVSRTVFKIGIGIILFDLGAILVLNAMGLMKYVSQHIVENLIEFARLVPFWQWILIISGIFALREEKKTVIPLMIILWGINMAVFISWPPDAKRFLIFSFPFLILFTVIGIHQVAEKITAYIRVRPGTIRMILLIVLVFPAAVSGVIRLQVEDLDIGLRDAITGPTFRDGVIYTHFPNELRYYMKTPFGDNRIRLYPYQEKKFLQDIAGETIPVYALKGKLSSPFHGTFISETFLKESGFMHVKSSYSKENRMGLTYDWQWYRLTEEKGAESMTNAGGNQE